MVVEHAVARFDEVYRCIHADDTYARLVGLDRADVMGREIAEAHPAVTHDELRSLLRVSRSPDSQAADGQRILMLILPASSVWGDPAGSSCPEDDLTLWQFSYAPRDGGGLVVSCANVTDAWSRFVGDVVTDEVLAGTLRQIASSSPDEPGPYVISTFMRWRGEISEMIPRPLIPHMPGAPESFARERHSLIISAVKQRLRATLRASDAISFSGTRSVTVLCPPHDDVFALCDRLRETMRSTLAPCDDPVTLSMAVVIPRWGEPADAVLRRAQVEAASAAPIPLCLAGRGAHHIRPEEQQVRSGSDSTTWTGIW